MTHSLPILTLVVWLPIIWSVVLLLPMFSEDFVRGLGLIGSVVFFILTCYVYLKFDTDSSSYQFSEHHSWIPAIGASYSLAIDGISLLFLILNNFLLILVVLASHNSVRKNIKSYLFCFFMMSGLINGAFSAMDGLLFYVFFEASLVPLYLVIGIWGGDGRVYAAFKFFIYTVVASLLFLVGLLVLSHLANGSFYIPDWHRLVLPLNVQILLFVLFIFAFAVKIPMFPFHTWLPNAHVEAPTGGSVILAAMALKLGAYGLLRFSLPILPDASRLMAPLMFVASSVAVIYIGSVAIAQSDMKKLIAYSSISHMGFVTFGIFSNTLNGFMGALFQMVSHGLVSSGLFFCVGVLYDRVHSRKMADYGGVINIIPYFSALFVVFAMANCGLPGTSGFVGELLVFISAISHGLWWVLLLGLSLVLSAVYNLWMIKRVIMGPVSNDAVKLLLPINAYESFILVFLAFLVVFFGLFPAPINNVLLHSVQHMVRPVV
ncbi:complex I subunit 4 family protein [Candidatus Ichthyocystis sparus]|uniref:complex I subunit 4 family protein n=1 Tax=Candidatus Ichthyocystis sparus TaxID=1561004 RepID=UPI000ABC8ADD|nr:NADH-quinone oxidoreductase subunit M [Candidatus Ichthyocystis sparus]